MMSKNLLSCNALIAIALTTSGCLHLPPYRVKRRKITISQKKFSLKKPDVVSDDKLTITIWVHGTRLLPNPIFSTYMYSPPGLNSVTTLDSSYHLRQIADTIVQSDPKNYPLDHFYIFGWSGKLNAQERTQAAQRLYQELLCLKAKYHRLHGHIPRTRIITHSHGGNIALQLAQVKKETDNLTIDELILLACPVQKKTMHYIEDPLFKKVYSLYSSLDMLQILAPQFCYRIDLKKGKRHYSKLKIPFFSSRHFDPSDKLAQVKVKINGRAILHTTFTSTSFTRMLPHLVDEISLWQEQTPQYPHDTPNTRRLMSVYA